MAFRGTFVLNMIDFASRKGVDANHIKEVTDKSFEELASENCVLENREYNKIIEELLLSSNDPSFGLHAGEHLNLSAAGLILQLSQTSETVKQALELCCEYANLGCSVLPMSLIEEDKYYKVKLVPDEEWKMDSFDAFRHTTEGVLVFTIREFHSLTHHKHAPISVYLPWTQPEDPSEYNRILSCPVYFNRGEIAILLHKEHVEEKVVTSDYKLLNILIHYAEEKSAELNNKKSFASIVRQSVVKMVKPEFPSLEQVASHLNMSSRTLQRRLKAEGISFKNLIEGLKKDFARNYIKRKDLTISEIAYLFNYNDVSAFSRSYKRWFGVSPSKHKA